MAFIHLSSAGLIRGTKMSIYFHLLIFARLKMGFYNINNSSLTGKLRMGLCPYCGNKIKPNNLLHLGKDDDCYDFVCEPCNPKITICMEGSSFPFLKGWDDFEKKELSHHFKLKRIHQAKIKNSRGPVVTISKADFM